MIENLLYVIAGFAVTYLSLEIAWHFTAYKIKGCIFKEAKTVLTAPLETRGGKVY
jgi:hypothetical protein